MWTLKRGVSLGENGVRDESSCVSYVDTGKDFVAASFFPSTVVVSLSSVEKGLCF